MANLVPELYCSDFARSLRFYVDLLGFQILYDRPEERFAYLEREGAELMIEEPTGRVWLTASLSYPFGRGINLQIAVSQIDKLYDKCHSSANPSSLQWKRNSTGAAIRSLAAASSSCKILTVICCVSRRSSGPGLPQAERVATFAASGKKDAI